MVHKAVQLSSEIKLKKPGYNWNKLLDDVESLRPLLPTDDAALARYLETKESTEKANWAKLTKCEQELRKNNPKTPSKKNRRYSDLRFF